MHEKRLHDRSAFITLTYDDRNLPPHGSLVKRDAQLFMKRLRKARGDGIRFFGCGEYGETTGRPHYHILLFNTDFQDMKKYGSDSQAGFPQYTSKELEKLWPAGRHTISAVTFRSAAYVAGYVLKKSLRPDAALPSGCLEPEFVHRSLKPGLGYNWFLKYQQEAYKHDSVIMEARETGIPRYYDTKYELVDKHHLDKLKRLRRIRAKLNPEDNTSRRRRTREVFAELKLKRFARNAQ